jgi:Immunoglobulin domain
MNFAICYFGPTIVLPQIVPFSFGDDQEINLDESASAMCSVTKGDPHGLKIYWMFQGVDDILPYNLTTNDGVVISRNGAKLSVLNIEAVKARHRGNYSCIAQNKAGFAQHSAYLHINGILTVLNFFFFFPYGNPMNFAICYFEPTIVLPQIVPFSFGEDEAINLDESASTMCSITKGDTQGLRIYWMFQGEDELYPYNLTTNDGIVISKPSAKMSVLGIEAVKARHRGNYTCFAQNKAGIAQHSAYLSINGLFFSTKLLQEFCNLFLNFLTLVDFEN